MSRPACLAVWINFGCLLGPMWLASAQGQVDRLPPTAAEIGQRPVLHTAASQSLDDPLAVPQLVDTSVPQRDYLSATPSYGDLPAFGPVGCADCYRWQLLPNGVMYDSYLAGGKEPRFATKWVYSGDDDRWLWDVALGGRVGLLRYGTDYDPYPEGWQMDFEGAVFARMDLGHNYDRELVSADFRVGVPWTFRQGPWEGKFAYYHLSSHLGDEYMVLVPSATRINYVRDCLVLGVALRPVQDLRLYAEAAWAFYTDGGAQPWEFQFGVDYSRMGPSDRCGTPFFAINGHLREEVDFGGGLTVQTGWQWASCTGRLFRAGVHYFNGMSDHRQFFREHEELIGLGLWYDY